MLTNILLFLRDTTAICPLRSGMNTSHEPIIRNVTRQVGGFEGKTHSLETIIPALLKRCIVDVCCVTSQPDDMNY